MIKNQTLIGPWARRFLLEHIVGERNLAHHTQAAYRDALALLLPFAAERLHKPVDHLELEDISPELLRDFLEHLERDRHCSVATRNYRLAALHSMARFVAIRCPERVAWCASLQGIPVKKTAKPKMDYLEKQEMDALLAAPDRTIPQGRRDHALLLFLYNTGARADETARTTIQDLDMGSSPSVRLMGKGRKSRLCPLLLQTIEVLQPLIGGRTAQEPVFLNRRGQPITRFGIHALVHRHVQRATAGCPSLRRKKVSPHTLRHTAAMHLLLSGVDINTIRAWLGHVHLDTTMIYAEANLKMKAEALAHCEVRDSGEQRRPWREDPGVMTFLRSL